METAEAILEYWFGSSRDDAAVIAERSDRWWKKHPDVDAEIRRRFEGTLAAELRGALAHWGTCPRASLARILLLDQFPRHLYRGTPQAFVGDARARTLARETVDQGRDQALRAVERVFVYLPFEHAEDAADQRRSVELFAALLGAVPAAHEPLFRGFLDYAVRHKEVIERFGRFPHRNPILGRESTRAEREFLEAPGSSF